MKLTLISRVKNSILTFHKKKNTEVLNNSAKSKSITKGFRPYDESNNDLEEEFTESFEMTDSPFEDDSDRTHLKKTTILWKIFKVHNQRNY